MEITVRDYSIKDLKQIVILIRETTKYHRSWDPVFYSWESLNDIVKWIKKEKPKIIVAETDKKIIGLLSYNIRGEGKDRNIKINIMGVTKKYRKKGIGKLLMLEVIKRARKLKTKQLSLNVDIHNKKAINFYKKFDFKKAHYVMRLNVK